MLSCAKNTFPFLQLFQDTSLRGKVQMVTATRGGPALAVVTVQSEEAAVAVKGGTGKGRGHGEK